MEHYAGIDGDIVLAECACGHSLALPPSSRCDGLRRSADFRSLYALECEGLILVSVSVASSFTTRQSVSRRQDGTPVC